MRITSDLMEAVYIMLSEADPFCDWPLPDAHDIAFKVFRCNTHTADSDKVAGRWVIRVNENWCGSLHGLIAAMMHEMCHVAHGEACPSDYAHHGKWFKALRHQVCKVHLMDEKAF